MKNILAVLGIAFLVACTPTEKVVVQNELIERNIPLAKKPRGLSLLPVKFEVANDLEKVQEDYFCNTCDGAIVILSVKNYERLGLNTSEFVRYIEQSIAVREYYEGQLNE